MMLHQLLKPVMKLCCGASVSLSIGENMSCELWKPNFHTQSLAVNPVKYTNCKLPEGPW